jgi:hypothetical protein
MAWRRIDPRLVKQADAAERREWYWDDGSLDSGELLLWLDGAGRVARFQLAHARFAAGREYLAEWQHGGDLRLGEVRNERGGRHSMAPIIQFGVPDAGVRAQLGAYFARNAAVLPPLQRAAVAAALDAPPTAEPTHLRGTLLRPLADAVGGQAGGTGNGTAATRKAGRGGP